MLRAAAALLRYASEARRSANANASAQSPSSPWPAPRMMLAMEKRWCFTLRDLDSRAPAFDHFCSLVDLRGDPEDGASEGPADDEDDYFTPGSGDPHNALALPSPSKINSQGNVDAVSSLPQGKILRGRRICVSSIPKVLQGYDRGHDLELWELTLPSTL